MQVIQGRNINEIFPLGVMHMKNPNFVDYQASRYGETIEAITPVVTVTYRPCERVLFCPVRNANPFFHLIEAVWILAGRRDVAPLKRVLPRMAEFSDDGETFHAAYGYRLRKPVDQIALAVHELKKNPDSRRVVLQIWDHRQDLGVHSKDIPCNDLIFLKIRERRLHMRVMCRSNDMLWGAYGANIVQFSMLQEFIANLVGVEVGTLTQYSDSFHIYTGGPGGALWDRVCATPLHQGIDPYRGAGCVFPAEYLINPGRTSHGEWLDWANFCLDEFAKGNAPNWNKRASDPPRFFSIVLWPMMLAWLDQHPAALGENSLIDWHRAGAAWLARRHASAAS